MNTKTYKTVLLIAVIAFTGIINAVYANGNSNPLRFNSWNDVKNYLSEERVFVGDYRNYLVNAFQIKDFKLYVGNKPVGRISYNSQQKNNLMGTKVRLFVEIPYDDTYPMILEVMGSDKVCLYFEPKKTVGELFGKILFEPFYVYYIPMWENDKFTMGFSNAETYDKCPIYKYYESDEPDAYDKYAPQIDENVYEGKEVSKGAEFKDGGMSGLFEFIADNLQYPQQARDIQGTVRVEFIIEKNGNVSDVKINKSIDETLDKEACRIAEATNGKWYPAQKDGKAVRMKYILPIRFAMQ